MLIMFGLWVKGVRCEGAVSDLLVVIHAHHMLAMRRMPQPDIWPDLGLETVCHRMAIDLIANTLISLERNLCQLESHYRPKWLQMQIQLQDLLVLSGHLVHKRVWNYAKIDIYAEAEKKCLFCIPFLHPFSSGNESDFFLCGKHWNSIEWGIYSDSPSPSAELPRNLFSLVIAIPVRDWRGLGRTLASRKLYATVRIFAIWMWGCC